MSTKKLLIPIVLVTVFVTSVAPSNAQSIRLATGEWIPFTSENMEHYGKFSERVSIVLKEMGVSFGYVFYPWNRCYDSVLKGKVWAAFPYSFTAERAEKVWFTDALSCSKTVFFYYQNPKTPEKFIYDSLEDLKRYKLGGVRGYFYESLFNKAGLSVDYVNKEIGALEKLKLLRVDLVPVNDMVGWNLIYANFPEEIQNFRVVDKPLSVSPLRLIVSKDYPGSEALLERFNMALKIAIEKGQIEIEKCD